MANPKDLQRAVALLRCGVEQGTATIVAPSLAITTRHSVIDHLEKAAPIDLQLPGQSPSIHATLHPVSVPIEDDIVLLSLATAVNPSFVIQLSAAHLPVGDEWRAFGFPSSRGAGTWIDGAVGTWLQQGTQPQDVELSVNNFQAFRSYRGFSGAPVWVAGKVVAFLQRQLNGGLAATSVLRLRRYLDAAGVTYRSAQGARSTPIPLRQAVEDSRPNSQTYWAFENALRSTAPGYAVLAGAPGSGKTIIAAAFSPSDPQTQVVGTYFAGGDGDPARLPPEVHRDPGAFAAWLAQETALLTGEGAASRSTDNARAHAASIQINLAALGQHFAIRNQLGVLIIDDFCGLIGGVVDGALGRVLPTVPPAGLAIALTAASEAFVRSSAPHLILREVVSVTPLEQYDCERIVAAQLGGAIQGTDIIRIASASDGNPLILSYLVREAKNAIDAGLPLPPNDAAIPSAQAFYEQQWARLAGNDAGMWLVAFAARLRGRLSETELSTVLPDGAQVGLPTAWRTVGHLLRRENDGVEMFHSSFRDFVVTQTGALNVAVHDRLAEHCTRESSDYCVANLVFHHLRGAPAKQQQAAALCTQEWLDAVAARFTSPAFTLADIQELLERATDVGSLGETIRLLLVRSRLRFRYGIIFGKYAFELACVVSALRGAPKGIRLVLHDGHLLCPPHEAVELIRRLVLAEEFDAAIDIYEALRRVCFAQYQTLDVTWMAWHLQALGVLLDELGSDRFGELKLLYRMLDEGVYEGASDASLIKTQIAALTGAAHLWKWGWFCHSLRYRTSDPPRYAAELTWVVELARGWARTHGTPTHEKEPPPETDVFKMFTAQDAAAEIENACRGNRVPEKTARFAIAVLMRHGRDPQVVRELAVALSSSTVEVRQANGVDGNIVGLDALFQWSAIAEYLDDPTIGARVATSVREPWERRFLDVVSWLGATHGRLCRERREAAELKIDLSTFQQAMTFTLADRSLWKESYALPEAIVPFLFTRLCEVLDEFAPQLATELCTWTSGRMEHQLGLYNEGCRATLWELAEGLAFCDVDSARTVWRAHLAHVVVCTLNREERVAALLACAQGAADLQDQQTAEEALQHAIKASMGPNWYKEDQLALLVDALNAANDPKLTDRKWLEVVRLLEHASGDVTFQRFIRYEKENLVSHLSKRGRLGAALSLAKNYIWPDEATQLGRIESWRADKVTLLDGGRWGCSEIDPQAAALALLEGVTTAPARYRWAIIELFLPGDDRHFSSFARFLPPLFESEEVEEIKARLLRLLVADFVPYKRTDLVRELRKLKNSRINEWLDVLQREHDWARAPSQRSIPPPPRVRKAPETGSEDSLRESLYSPGLFGRPEGYRLLQEAIRDGESRLDAGDALGARGKFVEGLAAAQSAGWGIWRSNSEARAALRGLFAESGDPAASVRALREVILGEEHALDWEMAGALIDVAIPGRDEALLLQVVDEVFKHTRTMLAPELSYGVEYEVRNLLQISEPPSAVNAVVSFLLSALDDPCCHFRDRAASVLRWLVTSEPSFDLDLILEHARSAPGKHSRELCLGIIHSWFVMDGEAAKAALASRPTFLLLRNDPSFVARYVVSQVEGTALPSPPARLQSREDRWRWQSDCQEILDLPDDLSTFGRAVEQLHVLCGEFDPWTAMGLWRLRRTAVASKDFWSSGYEREAAWRAIDATDSETTTELADQLMWNPQWPDADLDLSCTGLTERIFERVRNGDLDDCFIVGDRLVLHCREATFDEERQSASQLEVVALLVPSAHFTGEFDRELLYERRSTHGRTITRPSLLATPVEPAVVKFTDRRGCVGGSMTPALPSQRLLDASRAPASGFKRSSWRDGREWEPVGVGRPLRDGALLTADRNLSTSLAGLDLVWCLLRDGRRVAVVDAARRKVFKGDAL